MPDYVKNSFSRVEGVKALSPGRPVFALLVDDDNTVVIKQETGSNTSAFHHNFKVMKLANPKAAAKVLSATEMSAIENYLDVEELLCQLLSTAEPPDVAEFRRQMTAPGTWIKMYKAEGVVGLDSAISMLNANRDKTGIRKIAAGLNAPGGFETLGKILAADLYNHNEDRCVPNLNGDLATMLNERLNDGSRFNTITNAGNVIFAIDSNLTKPIGLDSHDPNSQFKDVTKTVDFLENYCDQRWFGRFLTRGSAASRLQYAKLVVQDLEDAFGPRNRKAFFLNKSRLAKNAAQRIAAGMDAFIQELRHKLLRLTNRGGAPAGLASRLDVINS